VALYNWLEVLLQRKLESTYSSETLDIFVSNYTVLHLESNCHDTPKSDTGVTSVIVPLSTLRSVIPFVGVLVKT